MDKLELLLLLQACNYILCKGKDLFSTMCVSPASSSFGSANKTIITGGKREAISKELCCMVLPAHVQGMKRNGSTSSEKAMQSPFKIFFPGTQSSSSWAVYLWTANSGGSLRLTWPAVYRPLQMGAQELQGCVDVKAASRESRHVRFAKALCKKPTAIGLHSEDQPKGCNINKGCRQGMWLKKQNGN